jgi:hypothetical protein
MSSILQKTTKILKDCTLEGLELLSSKELDGLKIFGASILISAATKGRLNKAQSDMLATALVSAFDGILDELEEDLKDAN